jgi:hypothetical protein
MCRVIRNNLGDMAAPAQTMEGGRPILDRSGNNIIRERITKNGLHDYPNSHKFPLIPESHSYNRRDFLAFHNT